MVTPFSQVIGTQAALNVLYGRYKVTLNEVDRLVLGYYGETPGPVDPDLLDAVSRRTRREPSAVRPGLTLEPAVDRFRAEKGPFASDEDMLLEYIFMPEHLAALRATERMPAADPATPTASASLVELVRDIASCKDIRHFHLKL
jgi:pyruvate/oxaloacetate carboxyltransferase